MNPETPTGLASVPPSPTSRGVTSPLRRSRRDLGSGRGHVGRFRKRQRGPDGLGDDVEMVDGRPTPPGHTRAMDDGPHVPLTSEGGHWGSRVPTVHPSLGPRGPWSVERTWTGVPLDKRRPGPLRPTTRHGRVLPVHTGAPQDTAGRGTHGPSAEGPLAVRDEAPDDDVAPDRV